MKQAEALKLALESAYLAGFNDSAEGYNGEYPFRDYGGTPTKDRLWVFRRDEYIREALAEQPVQQDMPKIGCVNHDCDQCKAQQQEPFVTKNKNGITLHVGWDDLPVGTKLYKSPPASKPWVGLTDEEIDKCYYYKSRQWTTDELVRHVEAMLREKNA